jgi:hypothetical protein
MFEFSRHTYRSGAVQKMPYNIRKRKCKQSDGDHGGYTLSYVDNDGDRHSACHTSRKKAKAQIAAIEIGESDHDFDESWAPPVARMVEAIENELALLAGAFPTMSESKSKRRVKFTK